MLAALGGGVPKACGGVARDAVCQVLGAAGKAASLFGGSTSVASGAGRLVGSISTTRSSGDASRARDAGRIEFERLVVFDMVSDGKNAKEQRVNAADQIAGCATMQNGL